MSPNGSKLIIVCGLPGSGKTTVSTKLERDLQAVRFCPDDWMEMLEIDLYDEVRRGKIEALQWKFGQKLLAQGLTVIIEWGTWGRSERDILREGARSLGSKVELYYLSAPPEVLFDRIQLRGREKPAIKSEEIARWMNIFEVPTEDERALFDNTVTISV